MIKIINKSNVKSILFALSILIILWIIFFILNLNSKSKEEVIKSFAGEWKIYFTNQIPESYTLNNTELTFIITDNEKEINKYYKQDEVRPAGTHILKCQSGDIVLFEVCGFDGLETSSCIVFGNFDLDKDKEILLVYYKDILNKIGKYSVIDFIDNKIHFNHVDDNTLVGKYIMEYFKSTYFIGFSENVYISLFFYISIFISFIILIYIIIRIIFSIRQ